MGKIQEFVKEQFDKYNQGSITLPDLLVNFADYGGKLQYDWLLSYLKEEIYQQAQ